MDSAAPIFAPFHTVQECSELINLTVWMRCSAPGKSATLF